VGHAGLRGIRFGLAQPAIFKTQLRALVRAAAFGPLRIMFPFVSSVQEVRAARALLAEARAELEAQGISPPSATVGIMIEVPSAAFTASLLAREVDFFTIGTNDLIQYTLAVDRTDERVSDRYEPLHPAVLRLLRQVKRAATRRGIPVSVCGEMASDPMLLRLLIGCGLTEFSMTPGALEMARRVVQETSGAEMSRIAAHVLTLGTVDEIDQFLRDSFNQPGQREKVNTE
jgi:phosphotransferase system enzyme I (PtsI)